MNLLIVQEAADLTFFWYIILYFKMNRTVPLPAWKADHEDSTQVGMVANTEMIVVQISAC